MPYIQGMSFGSQDSIGHYSSTGQSLGKSKVQMKATQCQCSSGSLSKYRGAVHTVEGGWRVRSW